ncbi:MAG: hypothetical protein RL095_2966 [Verrucomicrobiota bacterium]|jgi:drug/metabolite transporter (DMT)-like permease
MPPTWMLSALFGMFFFALGANGFARIAARVGPMWINTFKCLLGGGFFFLALGLSGQGLLIDGKGLLLLLSGALGLGLADLFILQAFREIGPARTFTLLCAAPLVIGTMSWAFIGESLDPKKFYAIFFFIAAALVLSGEKTSDGEAPRNYRKGLALVAVFLLLDGAGNVISRHALTSEGTSSLQVLVMRFAGAMVFFLIANAIKPVKLLEGWRSLTPDERRLAIVASLSSTVGGLGCYVYAMSQVEVAMLSGFALTLPLFATAIECGLSRRWPGPRLLFAAALSLGGGWILCR